MKVHLDKNEINHILKCLCLNQEEHLLSQTEIQKLEMKFNAMKEFMKIKDENESSYLYL